MGCSYSKQLRKVSLCSVTPKQPSVEVVQETTALPQPAAPPPTDDRLPLNARQAFLLKKSWKGIHRNMQATGVEMFLRLFRSDASLKELFGSFRNIDDDDILRENEMLEAHGLLIMSILDDVISTIDDVDHVIEICHRSSSTHTQFPGFNGALFWSMEQPFLDAVKTILEDRYTEQMATIYQITIKFILKQLEDGFIKAGGGGPS